MAVSDATIAARIRTLLDARAPAASICPSDAARALWPDPDWRDRMDDVRRVAATLAESGILRVTQGGAAVADARDARGPLRLRRGPRFETPHD